MTQYRLKKDTFGIPAGTIAERYDNWYNINKEGTMTSARSLRLSPNAVERSDEFEKVEELKHRVTVSCEGSEYEVYAEAWGDFIEEHALVDEEEYGKKCEYCGGLISIRNPTGKCDHLYYPENVNKNYKKESPKKWARAVIKYDDGDYKSDSKLFSHLEDAVAHFSRMHFGAGSVIYPARFDDEGYLIMEDEG